MRYDNSLTSNVQSYIANTLAKKISAAQETWEISGAAKDIRKYLCSPTTLNTPDFVIRRFIQANHQELLPKEIKIPDLLQSNNVPWEKEIIDSLVSALTNRSKACGVSISKKEWERYLSGSGSRNREKVFMIAFALQMGVDDTIDLLLAFNMEPYSVRYPLDLICLFCQNIPGKYTWSEAVGMLEEFLQRSIPKESKDVHPTIGMTRQISSDLEAIFAQNLPDADAKESLVGYMVKNSNEFVSFGNDKKPVYLPGYSLSRMDMFMRLSEYLAILYPSYSWTEEKLPTGRTGDIELKDWGPGETHIIPVEYGPDGKPSLPSLVRSMLYNSEWKDIVWNEKLDISSSTGVFENKMRILCQNYEQRIMKIERLRRGGKTVAFFERQDALLFIYFLIKGYVKLGSSVDPEDRDAYRIIDDMLNSGEDFDYAVAEAFENADYVFENSDDEETITERFKSLMDCFNLILAQMGYMNLYLPAFFDRFVVLSLLSADPDEITPLVMCQEELDYYEQSNSDE